MVPVLSDVLSAHNQGIPATTTLLRPAACRQRACRQRSKGLRGAGGSVQATKAGGPQWKHLVSAAVAASVACCEPAIKPSHPQDLGGQVDSNDAGRAAHATCRRRRRAGTTHQWHALRCAPCFAKATQEGAAPSTASGSGGGSSIGGVCAPQAASQPATHPGCTSRCLTAS